MSNKNITGNILKRKCNNTTLAGRYMATPSLPYETGVNLNTHKSHGESQAKEKPEVVGGNTMPLEPLSAKIKESCWRKRGHQNLRGQTSGTTSVQTIAWLERKRSKSGIRTIGGKGVRVCKKIPLARTTLSKNVDTRRTRNRKRREKGKRRTWNGALDIRRECH